MYQVMGLKNIMFTCKMCIFIRSSWLGFQESG